MDDDISGMLFGYAYGAAKTRNAEHQNDLDAMRRELAQKRAETQYQMAFKEAAAEVHEEIIEELRGKAKGRNSPRRLSDPKNVDGRNARYAEYTAEVVERLSGGRIIMSPASIDTLRRRRKLK